jgi:hypothetical protein
MGESFVLIKIKDIVITLHDVQLPVLLIIAAVAALTVCMWVRRAVGRNIASRFSGGAVEAAAQQVTADQLAARNRGTGGRTRRSRRARRTPSQISTKSLPAYMKEPGDQELVIIRSVGHAWFFWPSADRY